MHHPHLEEAVLGCGPGAAQEQEQEQEQQVPARGLMGPRLH